jgi:hypothetical protein
MLSHTPISPSIDIFKPYLMDSDLIYPTSSPEVVTIVDALEIPFPKISQFCEANEMDDKASPNRGDKGTPKCKSRKSWVSLTVTNINRHPAELPLTLWPSAGSNHDNTLGIIHIPPQPFHAPIKRKHYDQSPDPYHSALSISPTPKLPAKKWRPKDLELETSSECKVFTQRLEKGKLKHHP